MSDDEASSCSVWKSYRYHVSTQGRIETVQGSASAVKREYLMYLDMRACVPDFKAATILTLST